MPSGLATLLSNDSLYQNIHNTTFWSSILPQATEDTGAWLTLYNDAAKANLTFNNPGDNLVFALPLISQLLDGDKKLFQIFCTYPLSGQYSHLPRILFYVCVIAAILLRHRTWLAKVGLGVVMSYSATSCIHLFVLLCYYDYRGDRASDWENADSDTTRFGDIDFWGIAPVVATSAIMMIPVLHWSASYQWNKGRTVLVYWSCLIIVAFGFVVYYAFQWGHTWTIDMLSSVAMCEPSCKPTKIEFPYDDVEIEIPWISTIEQYLSKDCQCNDFCGLLSPNAPLRMKQNMVPHLGFKLVRKIACKDESCTISRQSAYRFQEVVFILWAVAFGQAILAFLCVGSNSEAVRNKIFRLLNAGRRDVIEGLFRGKRRQDMLSRYRLVEPRNRNRLDRRLRRLVARFVAGAFYLVALFGIFTSPMLFVASILLAEFFLGTISTAERSDAIGSWGPWVTLGLVLTAAIVVEYHSPISNNLKHIKNLVLFRIQYSHEEREEKWEQEVPREKINNLEPMAKVILIHLGHVLTKAWWNIKIRFWAFGRWLKDPEQMTNKDYDEPMKTSDCEIGAPGLMFHGYPLTKTSMPPRCLCKYCRERRAREYGFEKPSLKAGASSEDTQYTTLNGHDRLESA